jgi:hypothetical protein
MGNKIKGNRIHTVRMEVPRGTCTCQKPKLIGIPCSHILEYLMVLMSCWQCGHPNLSPLAILTLGLKFGDPN